MAIYK